VVAAGIAFTEVLGAYQASHQPPPGNIYFRVYAAKDGAITVGCLSDSLRQRLLEVLGLGDFRFKPGYDPATPEAQAFGRALESLAETLFKERTVAEWLAILEAQGIPAGPVRFVEELPDDPQVQATAWWWRWPTRTPAR
jgi:crotonobetainyl-CoA:carnitine CoA-transferase CaiB-like acyl-CoA transferase